MVKLLKIGYRSVSFGLEYVLLLFVLFSFAIRMPFFQTYIAQKASAYLSEELKTIVHIEHVDIAFFDHVYMDGIYVEDRDGDTLIYLEQIEIKLKHIDWNLSNIEIDKVALSKGRIYLIKKLGQDDFNYGFIEDYFTLDKKRAPKETKIPKIFISDLMLNDIDFKYILEYKKDYEHGINFNKLDLRGINLFVEDLEIVDEQFSGKIARFYAREKSGFKLNNFTADFNLNSKLLLIKRGIIETDKSRIEVPKLVFKTNTWNNYNYFEDSVFMDIHLDKTLASMEDIAYFSPDLWGMNQVVYVSGRATDFVYNLKLRNLYLETGRETILQGNFELPDFRTDAYPIPKQHLDFLQTSYYDLKGFRLPGSTNSLSKLIPFPKDIHTQRILNEAALVQMKGAEMQGSQDNFVFSANYIGSGLGGISASSGVHFLKDNTGVFTYKPIGSGLQLLNLNLGKISGEASLGLATGNVNFEGRGVDAEDLKFTKIEAQFLYLELAGYRYNKVFVKDAEVDINSFAGIVQSKDPNANFGFEGVVNFGNREEIEGLIKINYLDFEKIGITQLAGYYLQGEMTAHTKSFSLDNLDGYLRATDLTLLKDSMSYTFEKLNINIDRTTGLDLLTINSDVLQGTLEGDLEFNQIFQVIQHELSKILPILIQDIDDKDFQYNSFARFNFTVKDANSFLDVVFPNLRIENNTKLFGALNGLDDEFVFNLISPQVSYDSYIFTGIQLDNRINESQINATYDISRIHLNDSLYFDAVVFTASGYNSEFTSSLSWDEDENEGGEVSWETTILSNEEIKFKVSSGYFFIEQQKWVIEDLAEYNIYPSVLYKDNKFEVKDLMLVNGLQYISVSGFISNEFDDVLELQIADFDLDIVNRLYLNDIRFAGYASGFIRMRGVLGEIIIEGMMGVDDLKLNDNLLGTLDFESTYSNEEDKLSIVGELFNSNISKDKTNSFSGDYYFAKEVLGKQTPDRLDFELDFATMDISFANAFVGEEVASEIEGLVNGQLLVKGSSSQPLVSAELTLTNGAAKIGLLGTKYRVGGPINITNYGLSIVGVPIIDQENNAAILSASVFHENFTKWDYNIFLDLDRDAFKKDPLNNKIPVKLERFLALNTEYAEGEIFYGKGYVTGNVNIYGSDELVEITANVKSARGTQINFPMYGSSEIGEDDFVVFINNIDSSKLEDNSKIDFTGVRLNLNIEATEDARLRIIFDDRTGDEISAIGRGKFQITLNELNDVSMTGTYEASQGIYNFALGIVKKEFNIEPGSTVKWMGDPYDATLNIRTYYLVEANIGDITFLVDKESDLRTNPRDQIYCYLSLKDRLSQPSLEFDIEAPNATDAGRVAINRVRSDYDELTKQFFSLLLFRQFQPLRGTTNNASRGSNALNELLANQINAVLNQVSGNYDLRVKMNDDETAQQSTYELGFSTSFLDERLMVSGSFGVSQTRTGSSASLGSSNPLIGDINLEYKLNRSGTFRVNAFNRSNQFTVIQQHNLGPFTQGIGIYYQESFSGWHDFQLAQYTLDLFRSNIQKRYVGIDSRLTPVPPLFSSPSQDSDTSKVETEEGQGENNSPENNGEPEPPAPTPEPNAVLEEED